MRPGTTPFKNESPDFDVGSVASTVHGLSVSTHQRTQSSESIMVRIPLSRATSGNPFSECGMSSSSVVPATPASSVNTSTWPTLIRPLRTMQSLPAKWGNSDTYSCGTFLFTYEDKPLTNLSCALYGVEW